MKIGIKGWYSKEYHYSRHNSGKFWNRIKAIKNQELHHDLYLDGCRLQNLEEQVLKKLRDAERAAKGRKAAPGERPEKA